MSSYYSDRLSANRLKQCYDIAPPRVQQYLEAEVNHIVQKIRPGDMVLELGCGYGRILPRLAQKAALVIGIDLSLGSLMLGREMLSGIPNTLLLNMDAVQLAFRDRVFDRVACIQNGISAFRVNQKDLIRESIRVTKPGGTLLFSTYSDKFWKYRLEWFQLQSEAGLLGEIVWENTHDGVIVCKDGFKATTVRPEELLSLTAEFDVDTQIIEVDESSLFCEISTH
ncbi:MAG: class I SAM-dependent methyltransferase [Candidatus Aminicenantes bacterium]|nr:class I SAM-dependent methyltransferase [Candidatus Aminicenantes bacterium]